MLPHTYFYNLAKEGLVVMGGRIYQLVKGDEFTFKGKKYGLSESETIANLEELYQEENKEEIDRHQTTDIQKYVAKNIKNKSMTIKSMQEFIENNNALLLIFGEIIPRISGEKLLGNREWDVEIKDSEEYVKLEDYEEYREYQSMLKKYDMKALMKNPDYYSVKDRSIIGRYILYGMDVVAVNNQAYSIKTDECLGSIDDIERKYMQILRVGFIIKSLKNLGVRNKELETLNKQQAVLNKLIKQKEFAGKDGGFRQINSRAFEFWMRFPKFINKFPDNGQYYLFPAGKVKIKARYDSKDFSFSRSDLCVDGHYKHPYSTWDDDDENSDICIGEYKITKAMKEKNKGWENMITLLNVAKRVLLSGYNSRHDNIDDHYWKDDGFSEFMISEEKAKSSKIPITNVNVRGGL